MKRYLIVISLVIISLSCIFVLTLYVIGAINNPGLKSMTCLEKFTAEDLDFFSEVGFPYNNCIRKWESDINVYIEGKPMEGDVLLIDSIIEELKPLILPVKIMRSKYVGNLLVNFMTNPTDQYVNGLCQYVGTFIFSSRITKVEISIFSQTNGQARQACIRHEFLHALGLKHPIRRNTGTIIESLVEYIGDGDDVKLYRYSSLDKSMVKMLYSECIPLGLKKKTFLNAYKKQEKHKDQ